MPTLDDLAAHLAACEDGPACHFRTAEAWARSVALPEHVEQVRDLVMALHLADVHVRDHLNSLNMMMMTAAAIVRRDDSRTIAIEAEELIERSERLVIEKADDGGVTLSIVARPDTRQAWS